MGFDLTETGKRAKTAAFVLQSLSSEDKNRALAAAADALKKDAQSIISENQKDLAKARERGTSPAMIDRLELNEKRIDDMAEGLMQVRSLPVPTALRYRRSGFPWEFAGSYTNPVRT